MSIMYEPYVQEDRHKTGVCVDKPADPRIPSRFASWDRHVLERLAEELVAELNERNEELRVALKAYRKSVKDCDK